MTRAEWLACTDPREMIDSFLYNKVSDRKLRLFAIACCESSRPLLLNKVHRRDLEVSRRFVEGQATEEELAVAYRRASDLACSLYEGQTEREHRRWAEATAVANALKVPACDASDAAWMIHRAKGQRDDCNRHLADLLRDISGQVFRQVTFDPSWPTLSARTLVELPAHVRPQEDWLTWRDATVVKLAETIYQERAFERMSILADALEEAGCTEADILDHCRQPGPHTRGCWVVDLLTDRK